MRKKAKLAALAVLFLAGLCMALYPSFSDYMTGKEREKTIWRYEDEASRRSAEEIEAIKANARLFNQSIPEVDGLSAYSNEQLALYDSELNLRGDGVMGILKVPAADINLPVYHSTDDGVLRIGVGHVEGSSLPSGGEGTHAVLSSHTGMAGARLFTDLTKVREGDLFTLNILGETLTYKVYQIETVLPDETRSLKIEPGRDLVTLVTCTPYGINSHRLLVHGERTENVPEVLPAQEKPSGLLPMAASATILLIICVLVFRLLRRRTRRMESERE